MEESLELEDTQGLSKHISQTELTNVNEYEGGDVSMTIKMSNLFMHEQHNVPEGGEGQEASTLHLEENQNVDTLNCPDAQGEKVVNFDELRLEIENILTRVEENVEKRNALKEIETKSDISSISTLEDEETLDSISDSSSGDDKNKKIHKKYKIQKQFVPFILDFKATVDEEPTLLLNGKFLLDLPQDLFPFQLHLLENTHPFKICPNLKKLKLVAPNVLQHLKESSCKMSFRQALGIETIGFLLEESLRDRVLFILQTIQSIKLKSFALENVDDGSELFPNDRFSMWEGEIIEFLNRHSSTLKTINIHTVRAFGKVSKVQDFLQMGHTFSNLKQFEMIFWEKFIDQELKSFSSTALSNSYWVDFLHSRIVYGHLNKLIWMSSENISWDEIFIPVIQKNKQTLQTIHILCNGNQRDYEVSKSPLKLTCAQFSQVSNLSSLYLLEQNCFLNHLGLLPISLQELSIDLIYLESSELIYCITKLTQLSKLRLVNNIPEKEKSNNYYGVNEEVIKAILTHRKLNDVFILGYCPDIQKILCKTHTIDALSLEEFFKPKKSIMRKIRDCFKLKSRVKVDTMTFSEMQTLGEIIHEIASVNEDSIVINENTVPFHTFQFKPLHSFSDSNTSLNEFSFL